MTEEEWNRPTLCMYMSACSLGNKLEKLELYVQSQNWDIAGIALTQWDNSHDWSNSL